MSERSSEVPAEREVRGYLATGATWGYIDADAGP